VPGHLAANPNVEVLSDDRYPLQDGCPHPYYLERNPCLTECGNEL
jgi:hypothetical protein